MIMTFNGGPISASHLLDILGTKVTVLTCVHPQVEQEKVWNPVFSNRQILDKGLDRGNTPRSLLSLSEPSAPWGETSRKQPFSLTHCSYPRVFCNPVSDCENPQLDHTQKDSSTNPESILRMSTRNNQGSAVEEASPNSSNNSTSSNDMSLDVEMLDQAQLGNPPSSMTHQRCGVCKKLLSLRSPWCSHKMMRSREMPAAGVFPCHHVYHVECLDQVTTKTQTRDPPCPVCSNTIGAMEQQLIVPETLEMALTSLRRSRTNVESETLGDNQTRHIRRRSQKWEKLNCCLTLLGSSRFN